MRKVSLTYMMTAMTTTFYLKRMPLLLDLDVLTVFEM